MDRAHRIGQTKQVRVFRLITGIKKYIKILQILSCRSFNKQTFYL